MSRTSSRPATTISLHEARATQLRAIAVARGLSLHALIETYVNDEIEAGTIPDETPGFTVTVKAKHVWFVMGDVGLPPLTPTQTRQVADALDHFASPERTGKAGTFDVGDGYSLAIGRAGRGLMLRVHVEDSDSEEVATITPTMARDLARQLRKAADRVK